MNDQKILGIDIGGTKIHLGIVQQGEILEEVKFSTSAQAPWEQVLNQIIRGIEQLNGKEVEGIGIGIPGLVDEEQGIVYNVQNIPSWKKVPLKRNLEEFFNKPVFLTNDANSFILGEKVFGKAKPYKNAVGLTLGTGFGSGIIAGGRLYSGTLSSAGELGSIPYLDQTLEDYCSGKFFLKQYGLSGEEVYQQAEEGDEKALEILERFGHHIGEAIKIVLFAFAPEAIFLGGSVSSCYKFFKVRMEESIGSFPFQVVREKLVIELSEMKNIAVLGAAALYQMKKNSDPNPQMTLV
jgi:glucokinase